MVWTSAERDAIDEQSALSDLKIQWNTSDFLFKICTVRLFDLFISDADSKSVTILSVRLVTDDHTVYALVKNSKTRGLPNTPLTCAEFMKNIEKTNKSASQCENLQQ